MREQLYEDKRSELMTRGRSGAREKCDGKTRYEKRVKSVVSSSTSTYNSINMDELFKQGILTVDVPVRGETDDYEVKIKYGSFLDELREVLKTQNDTLDLRAILRTLLKLFDSEDVYIHCSCLHPDTRIKLMDGTSPTIAQMKERFDSGESLYVHSISEEKGLTWGTVENVWITEETHDFIRLYIENGESVLTTPDHLYMTRDGSWIPSEALTPGTPLMPSHEVTGTERVWFEDAVPVYDIKVKEQPNFMVDCGLILHNCPDFKYRMNYWCTVHDINSGEPENRPSNITNPHDNLGPGCKHVMLVLANNSWIHKVASVIWNYIKYFQSNRKKDYADIIYPAIYGKPYEEPVQLSMDDNASGELTSDKELINTANAQGAVSGRFRPGNEYRFQPNNSHDKNQISIADEINNS